VELRIKSDLRPMLADLARLQGRAATRATRKAANEAAKRLHALAVAGIQQRTGLSKTIVKKRLKRYRASARSGAARLWWGGYQIPLSQINKSQSYAAGSAKAGKVTVRAWGLFKATVRAGNTAKHTGPFVRKPQAATASGHVRRRRKRPGGRYSVGIVTRRGRLPIREIKFDASAAARPVFVALEGRAAAIFAEEVAKALAAEVARGR
jgi:hypothetical protein